MAREGAGELSLAYLVSLLPVELPAGPACCPPQAQGAWVDQGLQLSDWFFLDAVKRASSLSLTSPTRALLGLHVLLEAPKEAAEAVEAPLLSFAVRCKDGKAVLSAPLLPGRTGAGLGAGLAVELPAGQYAWTLRVPTGIAPRLRGGLPTAVRATSPASAAARPVAATLAARAALPRARTLAHAAAAARPPAADTQPTLPPLPVAQPPHGQRARPGSPPPAGAAAFAHRRDGALARAVLTVELQFDFLLGPLLLGLAKGNRSSLEGAELLRVGAPARDRFRLRATTCRYVNACCSPRNPWL